jgi:hypothetical protein
VGVVTCARDSSCRLRPPGNGRTRRLGCLDGSDERPRRKAGSVVQLSADDRRRASAGRIRQDATRPGRRSPAGQTGTHDYSQRDCLCHRQSLTLADGTQPSTPADQDSGSQLPSLWVAAHQAMLDVFARVTLSEASLIGVRPPIRRRGRRHRVASPQRLLAPGSP